MGTGSGGFVDVVTTPERRRAYAEAGWWDDQTLPGRVAHHAATRPDATAVVDESRSVTYGELGADAARLGDALRARGVGPGTVVSVQLPNRYETVVAGVAAARHRGGRQPAAAQLPGAGARATCSPPPDRWWCSPRASSGAATTRR